jgi:putative flippase GtrA
MSPSGVVTFARHQAGAVVATVIDFAIMSALVELLGASAVLGTVVGAATGGVTNFLLGRRWIFRAGTGAATDQATRYVAVSVTSLFLNAAGEYLLADRLGLQFQLARAIVAVVVSVAWNFPMHRYFVFAKDHPAPPPPRAPQALSLP